MDRLRRLRNLNYLDGLEIRRKRSTLNRRDFFSNMDDTDFHRRYRLSKELVIEICKLIGERLEPKTFKNNALDPLEQLLLTLRFYATGCFQIVLGDLGDVSQATASRVIHRVSRLLAARNKEFIKFPNTVEECREVSEGFFGIGQFPGVIGALDCTHVRISSPGGLDAERFRCRKAFFSLNVQTIISSDLIIENVVARWPGSVHDSTIFNNSGVCGQLQNNPLVQNFHLIGDSGYANQPCLLTPLQSAVTLGEIRYNKAHILTRNTVERKYGILKRRFPCLRIGLNCHVENVPAIIVACCVLHNLAVKFGDPEPPEDPEVAELFHQLATGQTAEYSATGANNTHIGVGTVAGEAKRRLIINQYFD